jgi:hypothetical protein
MRVSLAVLSLGLGLLLAGCAPQQARMGLPPEPVPVAPREGLALPLPLFYDEVRVRAFLRDEAGQRREVGNAACRLETPGYTATFRTPGRVVVPVWGVGSPALEVTCRAGELAGATRRSLVWRPAGPYPYYGPRRWPGDPFHPYGRRSGVWVGVEVGDPGWWGWDGWGDPGWPHRAAPAYPNIEVELR